MKPVTSGVEPAVLTQFRADHPGARWSEFKNEPDNGAVFDALALAQGFLCAYCEMKIHRPIHGQVEHSEPKSQSTPEKNLHLDFRNLLACCQGGTISWNELTLPPIPDTNVQLTTSRAAYASLARFDVALALSIDPGIPKRIG